MTEFLLTPLEAARATADRIDQLARDMHEDTHRNPTGIDARSQAAGDLIATLNNNREEDPQVRVARLLEAAALRDELRNQYALQILDAVKRQGLTLGVGT